MTRTKWMRLGVRDPADILRWAGAQSVRQLDEFRYRMIGGREFVSFRMVPRYAIEIGTSDIVVVAHVKPSRRQQVVAAAAALHRQARRRLSQMLDALYRRAPAPTAELYQFAVARRPSRSVR